MSIFAGKTLMITGGTGSFGNAVLNRFLSTDIAEIRIFSRDEKKQDDMRHDYQLNYPDVAHKIKFYIGDVRNLESCRSAMPGTDYIFHAAALKQVPSCEFFLYEFILLLLYSWLRTIQLCGQCHPFPCAAQLPSVPALRNDGSQG
jgi:UDP-glucose 4-epimerase